MAKRILVTGGAGFIGSHVADLFVARGDAVTVLDNLSRGTRANVPAAAEFIEGDIGSADATRLVKEGRFDTICHLAAQIDVRVSVDDPVKDATLNILGSLNLLEAVRTSGHRTRFIFSSTGGATYGDLVPVPTQETEPKNPESPYGTAKLAVEYYMGYYARIHGLDTVALRYANVFGPRQDPHGEAGVVAIFCGKLLEGQPLKVYGDGLQTRDYVYVGDVARANMLASDMAPIAPGPVDTRAFNIGTGVETNVVELAQSVMRAGHRVTPLEHLPARPGEQRRSCVQIGKAKQGLGWTPQQTLDSGVAATLAWFADKQGGAAR
jgi:UDP-glucose 4-epimerase